MNYEEEAKNAITSNSLSAMTNEGIKVAHLYSIACSLIAITEKLNQIQIEFNQYNRMNK